MDGYGEIRDKFGARNKKEERDNSVLYVSSMEEESMQDDNKPYKTIQHPDKS